jgi:hypothetical protein
MQEQPVPPHISKGTRSWASAATPITPPAPPSRQANMRGALIKSALVPYAC